MTATPIQFPEGYYLRPIQSGDYSGVLQVLSNLTTVGTVTKLQFDQWVKSVSDPANNKYVYVVEHKESGDIVATGTLIIEQKLIHSFGKVGHIEDITVSKDHQGRRIGQQLIKALQRLAEEHKVYKVLLNCSDSMMQYYEHMGLSKAGHMMTRRYD